MEGFQNIALGRAGDITSVDAEEFGRMGLAGDGAGKAGEEEEAYGMSGSQVMLIETFSLSCLKGR